MNESWELPLFPLDLVLLPAVKVPLRIFEERYKLMTNKCLDEKLEFGIVWGNDDSFREVGCAVRVANLIDRFSDGRMNILIEGTRRFKVIERFDVHPYISVLVEEVRDDPEKPDGDLGSSVQDLYSETLRLSYGWLQPEKEEVDLADLPFVVAAGLDLPLSEKQALLETRSVNRRLEVVNEILKSASEEIRNSRKRSSGNGHLN